MHNLRTLKKIAWSTFRRDSITRIISNKWIFLLQYRLSHFKDRCQLTLFKSDFKSIFQSGFQKIKFQILHQPWWNNDRQKVVKSRESRNLAWFLFVRHYTYVSTCRFHDTLPQVLDLFNIFSYMIIPQCGSERGNIYLYCFIFIYPNISTMEQVF